jgi:radical SAM protein with 4Fe4S-binding SPASM domain
MEWGVFTKAVDELAPHLMSAILYFQGEPLLHPEFLKMVNYCHQKRIYTYTSTNAQLIDDDMARKIVESGLDKIIISVDGLTPGVYATYRRGGNLNNTIEAIRLLAAWKKRLKTRYPVIEAQFIVMKHNEFQMYDFRYEAKKWGADKAVWKTAQIDLRRVGSWVPVQRVFSRYKKAADGSWTLKRSLKNRCWRQWSSAVVAVNGDVIPCCFDKNGRYAFGNIKDASFVRIWNGEKATAFGNAIRKNRKQFEMCRNCTG